MRNDTTHLNNELEAICLQYESLPMRALWEALQIKSFGGAKVISAFMQKCRCGLEQRATKPEGEMVASCGFKLGVKNCGATPLSIACLAGRHEVMKYLIDCGASVYAKELDHGVNPLHVAVFCNDERAIRLLVDAGGSSITLEKDNLGRSGVHVAAMMGLTEVLKLLISEGCDVNSEDRLLMLPIHYAASKNCVAAIRLLIECGSTLDAYCNFKWTPLYIAAKNGHVEAIELLAAKGADVNALDKELRNPLSAVLLYVSHMPTIMATLQTLLRLGTRINTADMFGQTLLHFAGGENAKPLELLLAHGADPSPVDGHGDAILHNASHSRVLTAIMDSGCDVQAKNKRGNTAAHLGKDEGAMRALLSNGCM